MNQGRPCSAGIDVGTECVKAVVIDRQGTLLGNTVVPRRGYFQDRVSEAYAAVLDDAQVTEDQLEGICATGFGENCVPMATCALGEAACHALGAWHHHRGEMTVIDIGGRDPKAIQVAADGRPLAIHTLRRCAAGIGTFLIFAARHLDVHPSRLQEMAAGASEAADIGSYCSTFSGQDILERLRDGTTREEVALGCIQSIAERVVEVDIEKQHYLLTLKGNEVVDIDPPGRFCPYYERDAYRENVVRWRKATRFVGDEEIYW